MTRREKRLITILGAQQRLKETRARHGDPKLIDALVLHLQKVIRALTGKEQVLILHASLDARDAAHNQLVERWQRPQRKTPRLPLT